MAEGTIKRLTDKGFGFIETSPGKDLFFHMSAVEGARFEDLRQGQRVSFTEGQGPKGPRAENVKLVLPDPVTLPRGSVAVRPLRRHACGGASSFCLAPGVCRAPNPFVIACPECPEPRGVFVVAGSVTIDGARHAQDRLRVLPAGARVDVIATGDARVLVLGGPVLDGPRYIEWNFVSSSKDVLEGAKEDWRAGRFPRVVGDDVAPIPYPPAR